jgi:predicted Zn-dependent protease
MTGPGPRRPGLAVAFACLLACAENPVTGERELALISEGQEVAMGAEAAQQVGTQLGYLQNDELQSYVANIGLALARDSERPDLPWEFRVVDDPTPNAFALPGGYIFVTRGLLNLMRSEAELAAVLGHEIGHVTARHSVNQLSRAQLAQLGLGIGMVVVPELQSFGGLADLGLSLLFLRYGRDDERQADELGFKYMLAGGYDVREMDDVFQALLAAGEMAERSPLPSWFASHPSEPERIEAAQARVAALGELPPTLESREREFFAQIDGIPYGSDPRDGYFEGGMFYHPELAFQFAVPESWQAQNLPTAVSAVSPEQDSALQLTLTPGSPVEAAQRFLSQSGLQALASERTRINGYEAVVSRFAARTQGGMVQGLVAHIAGGEASFQLVTYATEARYASNDRLFREIVGSFAPVTDAAVLDVQAQRIEVVFLDRDMSLADFAERYPSTVPLEELAVINQVDDAARPLPSGRGMKRVVDGRG